jgi:DNA recombination protein RmuC
MDTFGIVLLLLVLAALIVLIVVTLTKKNSTDEGESQRMRGEMKELKEEHTRESRANREEMVKNINEVNRSIHHQISEMNATQLQQITTLTKNNEEAAERLRLTVDDKLREMYTANEKKLDEMRRTVDEKLENTLNKRIGESFGLVTERLEMVNKSLGEMQGLSTNLTDIKKIFSNVKARGVWGEVQLAQILEEILTPDQYVAKFSPYAKSQEQVEFAVCLPGRDDHDSTVYLPIDSKFPVEDYQRLIDAVDQGDPDGIASCRKSLEKTLKTEAKMICDKYIAPPKTLEYAIMFLPTEGLYSEALRLPGFMEYAGNKCHVMVAGPTNLAALLNSIKLGFKTLAIEEKSGEIKKLLAMVKADMAKFGMALEKAQKKISEADKTISDATHRTEIITKKLKNVEVAGEGEPLLADEIQTTE